MPPKRYAFLLTQNNADGTYVATNIDGWGWFSVDGSWRTFDLYNNAASTTTTVQLTSPGWPTLSPFSVITASKCVELPTDGTEAPCVRLSGDLYFGLVHFAYTPTELRSVTPTAIDWILACLITCRLPSANPSVFIHSALQQAWVHNLQRHVAAISTDTRLLFHNCKHDGEVGATSAWNRVCHNLTLSRRLAPAMRNSGLLVCCITDLSVDMMRGLVRNPVTIRAMAHWGLATTGRPLDCDPDQWAADEVPRVEQRDESKYWSGDDLVTSHQPAPPSVSVPRNTARGPDAKKRRSVDSDFEFNAVGNFDDMDDTQLYLMRFVLFYAFWMSSLGLPIHIHQKRAMLDPGARWQIAGRLGLPVLDIMLLCHRVEWGDNPIGYALSDFYETGVFMPLEYDLREIRARMVCVLPPVLRVNTVQASTTEQSPTPVLQQQVREVRLAHGPIDPVVCGLLAGFIMGPKVDQMRADEWKSPDIHSHTPSLLRSHGWKGEVNQLWDVVAVYGSGHADGDLLRARLSDSFDLIPYPPNNWE